MDRRNRLGTALVVLAVALFVLPALFPVQMVLLHDTGPVTFDSREQLEEQGIDIVAYEDLSDDGRDLYVRTLENGGEYSVAPGEGAPDFDYLTAEERGQRFEEDSNQRPGYIAIERPGDADIPPADEPFTEGVGERGGDDGERREQAQRYDLMETSTGAPPIDSTPQLLRLGAAVLAVVSFGLGGYLLSAK